MSLRPQTIGPVPEETVRVARAAYPKGNLYLSLHDHLGTIYEDKLFARIYPKLGQPAYAPWRLALISLMQFLEGLSDRQAADAVRGRIERQDQHQLDPHIDRHGTEAIKVKFSSSDCRNCPCQRDCTSSQTKYPRRLISIRPEEQYHALQQARQRATTLNYKQEYTRRAGIEGTISQAVRTCEVRRSRYRGLPKTHLHHVLAATALNFLRMGMWLAEEPLAQTRHARFVRLYQAA